MPRQTRAKATVDAIVEATTRVLLEEGYDRFTTARAAERAGVSIGSLYQYFPNKAALASAVIDHCCEDFVIAFERALAAGPRRVTLDQCVRAIVDVTLVSHRLAPDLHRIVIDLAPHLDVAERTATFSRAAAQAIELMLRKHADEIAPDIDLAAAANIVETLLEALAHRALSGHPVCLENDMLARETTRFIVSYLVHGSPAGRMPGAPRP